MFQSTRPRGARLSVPSRLLPPFRFNPRARAGRDGLDSRTCPFYKRFNPRARAGRDLGAVRISRERNGSIHAPARGATSMA